MAKKWKLVMLKDWDGGRKKGDEFEASADSAKYFEKEKLAKITWKPKTKAKKK